MDENYIQLLAEIESLKSQLAELRMAQAGEESVGGAGGAVGAMLVPIGQIGGSLPMPFDIDGGYVVRCEIPAPISVLTCSDYEIDFEQDDIYVHVDRDSNGYTLSVDQTSRAESSSHAEWLLYKITNGSVTMDCRPGVLPVFDLT